MGTANSPWEFFDESQKKEMLEEVTKENCGKKLLLVQRLMGISRRELAKTLGVSEATIRRLESGDCLATDEFLYRLHALCVIGRAKFESLSESDREKISGLVGAGGGVAAGVGAGIGAVAVAGEVAGLSAAGISSGLAAIGGSMLGGIAVVAVIPVGTGLLGWGLVQGIKKVCAANALSSEEIDGRWELRKSSAQDYWVFFDSSHNTSMIHIAHCKFCNYGNGINPTRNKNEYQWGGPFRSRDAVISEARAIKPKWTVAFCDHCKT